MGKVFINEETLIGIGNAIREKSGTTDLINTTDMANAILNLPSGGGTLKYAIVRYASSASSTYYYDISQYVSDTNTVYILMTYYDYHYSVAIENGVMGSMYSVDDGKFFNVKTSDSRNTISYADGILTQKHGGSSSYAPGYITVIYCE